MSYKSINRNRKPQRTSNDSKIYRTFKAIFLWVKYLRGTLMVYFPDVLERSAARQVAFLQHEWAFYSQTAICLKLEYNGF